MFVSPFWFFVATAPVWAYFLYKIHMFIVNKFSKHEGVATWSKEVMKRGLITGSLLMFGVFWAIMIIFELTSRGII